MAEILPFQTKHPTQPDRARPPNQPVVSPGVTGRGPAPLWRDVLGRSLRAARERQRSRLVDVARRAGISPQYLSEIERGLKEPSSEMIAAVTGALGIDLADLLADLAIAVHRTTVTGLATRTRSATDLVVRQRPAGPVLMIA